MADLITADTELLATKQDLIIAMVQRELKYQAKVLPYVTDLSMFAVKGAKSISYPKFDSFTVVDRASGVAGDASKLTASVDLLALDKNAYVAWLIDSSDEIQSTVDVQAEFIKRATAAHARYVDEQLLAAIEAAAGYTQGVATVVTRDIILDMREALLSFDALRENLVLFVPPVQEKAMLKIDEFTRADAYGSSNIPAGVIGQVFGIPVVIHNGMTSTDAFMWDKNGAAIGFQKAPAYSEQGANEYGAMSKRAALDQLFGVTGLQLTEKGVGAGNSPLIASMN